MPTVDEARITITGDVTGISTTLDGVEGKATKVAASVGGGFSSEFNKATSAGAAFASALGGPFAKIGALAQGALKPITEIAAGFGAVGVATGGLAAGAVAVGLLATSAVGLANSAGAARDRLEDMGIAVGGEAATDLDSYAAATRDLGIAMDQVRVAIGSDLAGELAIFARIVASNTGAAMEWATTIAHAADVASDLGTFGLKPLAEILGGILHDDLTDNARAASEAAGANQRFADALKDASTEAAKLNNEMERQAQSDISLAQSAARAQAVRDEAAALRARTLAEQEAQAQHQLVMDARIAGWRADADASALAAQQESADAAAVRAAMLAANEDIMASADATMERRIQDSNAATEVDKTNYATMVSVFGSAANQILGSLQQVDQATIASFEARLAGGEKVSEGEIRLANAAQDRIQAEAIVQAAIQSTIAGVGMIAALAPAMGPYAIPVGVAIAGGLFAAATAAIYSASPLNYSYGDATQSAPTLTDSDGDGQVDHATKGNGENSRPDVQASTSRSSGGGGSVTIGLDPRLSRLRFTTDTRVGKREVR